MLNRKELTSILLATIVLGFSLSLLISIETFLYICLIILIVILINVFTKKITAYYLDSEIEINPWELERYGMLTFVDILPTSKTHPSKEFKRPFPIGLVLPLITTILSQGFLVWMAVLTTETKAKVYRAAKRYGLYEFSEITEYHEAWISASGIIANLFFAIIGYLIGIQELATLNIYYAFFNMIPISKLDGNRIFFGNQILWITLSAIVLISIGYVFLLV